MAALSTHQLWVGASRRVDGDPRHPGFWPQGYVTLKAEKHDVLHLTPDAARATAKRLKAFADVLDPPAPRRKRTG